MSNRKVGGFSMKEEYRVIKEFPRYSISNFGNVKNNKTGHIISQRKAANGYMRVNLRYGDRKYEKPKTRSTHRLVAEHFLNKVDGKDYVNHRDLDKTNNKVDNLEWVTAKENSVHAYKNDKNYANKCLDNLKISHERSKKLIDVYKGGKYIGRFKGKKAVSQALKINEKTVYNGLKGTPSRKGYTFFSAVTEGVV